jgi:hypothetical protein
MAYLQQDDKHLIEDLLTRKEFYWLKRWDYDSDKANKAKFLKNEFYRTFPTRKRNGSC